MPRTELDAEEIRERIAALSPESVEILREVLTDIRSHGSNMSKAQVTELAKKLASKARNLAKTESDR